MIPRMILLFCLSLLMLLATVSRSRAEESDRFRPYFRFASGDIAPLWDVDDMWSFALGANLSRHWGSELGIDFYERDYEYKGQTLGEIGAWHLVPEVRLRTSFLDGRLVPYLIAGAGASFLQLNDRKEPAWGRQVEVEGSTFTMTGGAGIEYFTTDNMTFGIEGKYFWLQPVNGNVDGQRVKVNLSAPTFTFGVRVYTDENRPRPLADSVPKPCGRFYFGVRAGGAVLTDSHWVPNIKLEPEPCSFGAVNQTGGLMFGWDFNRNWGFEFTVDSLEYRINVNGYGQVGEYGMGIATPQVRYRMPLADGRWVPYLTAGMGFTYGEFNDKTSSSDGLTENAKGIYPSLSVGAGVDYFLIRNVALMADVGWFYTWNQQIQASDTIGGRGDFSAFMFHIGFRAYLFD
jgi:opacity protein-like surface antigen